MSERLERAAFAVLLLLHLTPLVIGPAFPSQDGASHLEAAYNLQHYDDPDHDHLRLYYVRNPMPEPNLLGHVVLVSLMKLAPPLLAEKLMVGAYVAAFVLTLRYALNAVAPSAGGLAVLGFPFVYSWPLHMGFFNFCWGLPLFFATFGLWLRHRRDMPWSAAALLASSLLLAWSAHIVPLLLALALIGLWFPFAALAGARLPDRTLLRTACAAAPVCLLLGFFLWRKQPIPSDSPPFSELLRGIVLLESLVSFRSAERLIAFAVVALVAVLVLRGILVLARTRRLAETDALLAAALLFLAVYFLAPRRIAGGAYLNERLALFPFFALLLWLGRQELSTRWRQTTVAAASLISLAGLSIHLATYAELAGPMREYLSAASRLQPHRTLLPLSFAPHGWGFSRLGPRVRVFLHTGSYVAVTSQTLNLANYEGNYVHFPLIFREELNPFVHLADAQGLEGEPPCVDLDAFTARTGQQVDYVLLWGLRGHHQDGEPCTRRLLQHLERDYDSTYVSERRLVRLYERRRGPWLASD